MCEGLVTAASISGTIIIAMPNHQMTTLNKRLTQQIPRDR